MKNVLSSNLRIANFYIWMMCDLWQTVDEIIEGFYLLIHQSIAFEVTLDDFPTLMFCDLIIHCNKHSV